MQKNSFACGFILIRLFSKCETLKKKQFKAWTEVAILVNVRS